MREIDCEIDIFINIRQNHETEHLIFFTEQLLINTEHLY